jgi:DnaJ-domain-containing protein 1
LGIFRRISLILRGCLSTAEDRINQIAAEEELRLAKARLQASSTIAADTTARQVTMPPQQSRLIADYKTLSLKPGSTLDEVEAAWRRLASRADPKRFPSGSDEEKRAAGILESINKAYAHIREELNPTEGRFGRLEL